jgi:hypothetical protein
VVLRETSKPETKTGATEVMFHAAGLSLTGSRFPLIRSECCHVNQTNYFRIVVSFRDDGTTVGVSD